MELAEFQEKAFPVLDWSPTTGLGHFDAALDAKKGKLAITVRARLNFVDTMQRRWDGGEKTAFTTGLQLVTAHWNKKFKIQCKKRGWESLVVRPKFTLESSADRPHFEVKIVPTMGTANTAVRPDGTATFGIQAVDRLANAATQLDGIKRDMKMPLLIPIGDAGGQFSILSMDMLQLFARSSLLAFEDKVGKVTIKVTGQGAKDKNARKSNAEKVVSILKRFGLDKGKFDVRSGAGVPSAAPPAWVEIAYKDSELEANFPKSAESALNFSQATIVHEFGHMLGLPDEYNALCSESAESMVGLQILGGTDRQRQQESAARLKDFGVSGASASKADAVKQNQKRFVELCGDASIPVPPFGRANPSVMSCGSVYALHHCITAWEALCELTKDDVQPEEWQIQLG